MMHVLNKDDHISTHWSHEGPEPIAVIGFDFTFPGEASSEEALWDMLINGHVDPPGFRNDRFSAESHDGADGVSSVVSVGWL
jgi:acyl transferase domain-containing protein